jgi:uncharacterized protein (DUF1499 family)
MKKKLIIVTLIAILGLALLSTTAQRPDNLGVVNGRLAAMPDSPNAVSSFADDPEMRLEPIPYASSSKAVIEEIAAVIRSLPRTTIIEQTDNYLYVEFRSLIFRYVDDVEFFADDETQQVQFRSASRVGYSDLGVNRRRMERILELLKTQQP